MKKLFITALAVLGLAACSNDWIVDQSYSVINFGSAFVENSTRAALDTTYNTGRLKSFQVYSTITTSSNGVANIFNGEIVKNNGTAQQPVWQYDVENTQYWIPGNTYKFWAIVDGNVENATAVTATESDKYVPTKISITDASKQQDILAAYEQFAYESGEKTIYFTFKHLLSKVKFTVKNTITTDNGYSVMAKNIKIVNAAKAADYVITNEAILTGTWNINGSEVYPLAFGNATATGVLAGGDAQDIQFGMSAESNWDRLLIPATAKSYVMTFDYELYKDGVLIDSHVKTINHPLTLEAGNAYNFIVSLGNPGEPIKFDVTKVEDWDKDFNNDGDEADDYVNLPTPEKQQ